MAIGVSLALATFGNVPRAAAQTAQEIAAAKKDFAEGIALEEKSSFAEALVHFRKAAAVKKTPQILFHVGLCESKTGALLEAAETLGQAMQLARGESNDKVESAAKGELDAVQARIPRLELAIVGQPESVTIDGKPAATDKPVPLNPGSHQVVAHYASGDVTNTVAVTEGAEAKLELRPPAAAPVEPVGPMGPAPSQQTSAPSPAPATPSGPEVDRGTGGGSDALAWVLVGGGAVAVIGGFVTWKLRGDQIDTLDSLCPAADQCPRERESEVEDAKSKGGLYSTLSVGLWGVGAAALGTGGYLLLGSSSDSARVAPALGPGVAGAQVSGRF
jgi:hypothetical protein